MQVSSNVRPRNLHPAILAAAGIQLHAKSILGAEHIMQQVNDFLTQNLGGSALLWDVALGVLIAKAVATVVEGILDIWLQNRGS